MTRETLLLAYTVLLGAGTVGCAAFIGIYTAHANWWRSEVGAHVVAFTAALGFVEAVYFVRLFVGDWAWRHEMLALGLLAVVVTTWWRVELLRRVWRNAKRRDRVS